MFNTRQKIALARWAYLGISWGRSLAGLGKHVTVSRHGIRWSLDLSEGVDFSIYLLGAFEPGMVGVHQRLIARGQTVVDIGANIGAHTLHFSKFVGESGHVIAIEPTDWAFEKLRTNIGLNPELSSGIRTFQVLLGSKDGSSGERELYSSWPLSKHERLHEKHRGRLMSATRAKAITLDTLLQQEHLSRVDLIKIDVDGNEWSVLQGAQRTLEEHHPLVVMEFAPYLFDQKPEDFSRMISFFKKLGYRFFDAESGEPFPDQITDIRARIPDGASRNLLLRPTGPSEK